MVRLTWKDGLATLAVAAAVIGYLLWSSDTALTGLSTRGAAVAVFVLGLVGCSSTGERMGETFGGQDHSPLAMVVLTSAVGAVALVAGLAAMIAGSSTMLGVLVVAVVVLWVLATAHHLVPDSRHHAHRVGVHH
jgi:hypothetical protein